MSHDIDPNTPQVLEDAADLIELVGWCQEDFEDEYGQVCLMGALNSVTMVRTTSEGIEPHLLTARRHAEQLLIDHLGLAPVRPTAGHPLPDWNDAEGRTMQQVLDALRETAKAARA